MSFLGIVFPFRDQTLIISNVWLTIANQRDEINYIEYSVLPIFSFRRGLIYTYHNICHTFIFYKGCFNYT